MLVVAAGEEGGGGRGDKGDRQPISQWVGGAAGVVGRQGREAGISLGGLVTQRRGKRGRRGGRALWSTHHEIGC